MERNENDFWSEFYWSEPKSIAIFLALIIYFRLVWQACSCWRNGIGAMLSQRSSGIIIYHWNGSGKMRLGRGLVWLVLQVSGCLQINFEIFGFVTRFKRDLRGTMSLREICRDIFKNFLKASFFLSDIKALFLEKFLNSLLALLRADIKIFSKA